MSYKGFSFRQSLPTGGKAGKGRNKTRSIHVVSEKYAKGRYFSYTIGDGIDLVRAITAAKKWIDKITQTQK
jgi:hypothetical protein